MKQQGNQIRWNLLIIALAITLVIIGGNPVITKAQWLTPSGAQNVWEGEEANVSLFLPDASIPPGGLLGATFTLNLPAGFDLVGNTMTPGSLTNCAIPAIFNVTPAPPPPPGGGTTYTFAFANVIGAPCPAALDSQAHELVSFTIRAPGNVSTPNLAGAITITGLTAFGPGAVPIGVAIPPALTINVYPINQRTVIGNITRQANGGELGANSNSVQLYAIPMNIAGVDSAIPLPAGGKVDLDGTGKFSLVEQNGIGRVRLYSPPLAGLRPVPDGFLPVATDLNIVSNEPPQVITNVVRLAGDVVSEPGGCPTININDILAIAIRVQVPGVATVPDTQRFDLDGNGFIQWADVITALPNFGITGYYDPRTGAPNATLCLPAPVGVAPTDFPVADGQ